MPVEIPLFPHWRKYYSGCSSTDSRRNLKNQQLYFTNLLINYAQ